MGHRRRDIRILELDGQTVRSFLTPIYLDFPLKSTYVPIRHRIFAELLEHGLRNGLHIPSLAPPPLPHALPHSASTTLTPSTSDPSASTTLKPTLSPATSNPLAPTLAPGLTSPVAGQGINAALSSGQNPTLALQHPGFYYYIAAGCSQQRLSRFKAVLEAEVIHGHLDAR